jgi:hypothetical protein
MATNDFKVLGLEAAATIKKNVLDSVNVIATEIRTELQDSVKTLDDKIGNAGIAGPEGPQGPQGNPGETGVGIQSIENVTTESDTTMMLKVTLTDGSESVIPFGNNYVISSDQEVLDKLNEGQDE